MPRFEVHIPSAEPNGINVTLRVDAEHWMAALRTGLLKLGEQGSSVQNVLVDIQGDGSVHVTESANGRVFEIRELKPPPDAAPTLPAIPIAAVPRPGLKEEPALGSGQYPRAESALAAPPSMANATSLSSAAAGQPNPGVLAPPAPRSTPRRDSAGWPWAASLSPGGEIEGAPAQRNFFHAHLPRTPAAVRRLEPSSVIELLRPTQAAKGQIGRALDRKRDRRAEIEDALSDVFERVQGAYAEGSAQSALYLLLDLALEKMASESGSVLTSDAVTGDLTFAAARGPKAAELLKAGLVVPAGMGIAGFCAAEGVSVALSDVQRDPRWYSEVSERLRYDTKSVLCAPMMTHGRAFGCMQLINRKGSDAFTEHEIGMLAYIAHQGALYLNSRI